MYKSIRVIVNNLDSIALAVRRVFLSDKQGFRRACVVRPVTGMSEDKHVACVAGGDTKEGKADNTVKEGKADNTVKEGKADNTVKEGKADNTVKEGKADNTVKEGKADNTVKEGKADNTVKEGKADNTVKEGKADNIVKEGKAEVFSPPHVFYNPVQEFNRDLTIAVVSEFAKEHFSKLPVETGVNGAVSNDVAGKSNGHELLDKDRIDPANVTKTSEMQADELSQWKRGQYHANGIRVLEGLAATGLRSVRFALELPGVKEIVCNDFDETAFAYIKKNCAHNKVEHLLTPSYADAAAVMYQNKRRHDRFDVIDLDPYGSPVTFLDSAVQAVKDGGLLCVTCTDMGVLCGNASETCYSKYGSVSLRTKYCHEMAVRIVLRCIDSHANRYSRYIVPVLSLSIDFYVRVFVKVYFGQSKVKQSLSKTSLVHHCSGCGAFVLQPMGMCSKTDGGGVKYSPAAGPTVSPRCAHCGFTQHLAGPIWSDPIHDVEFVQKVLAGVEADPARFRTSARITGMLTVVTEELPHVPLYYITDDLCRIVHCTAPRFIQMRSALLHAGYRVSMSHAQPNSLKTDAPNHVIWDIIRCWTKENPVNEKRLKEGAPAHAILAAESGIKADFSLHPEANPKSREKGLLRWQANPERDWGPMPRAKLGEMKTLEERRLEGIHKSRMRREKRKARSGGESTEKRPKGDTDTCGKMEEGASEGSQPPPEGNQPQQN